MAEREIITKEQLTELLDPETRDQNMDIISRWLARGDGCAVYTNMELGHPNAGHRKFTSFGSKAAQLEVEEPPTRLPDIGSTINWRYQLTHVCKASADDEA
jgi:hypothetical protein